MYKLKIEIQSSDEAYLIECLSRWFSESGARIIVEQRREGGVTMLNEAIVKADVTEMKKITTADKK